MQKDVFEKLREISHLEELDRQTREIMSQDDHPEDNATNNTVLPTFSPLARDLELLEPIVLDDNESVASTTLGNDLNFDLDETFHFLDLHKLREKVLSLGVNFSDASAHAELLISQLSDAQIITLLDPNERKTYLLTILFEGDHQNFLTQVVRCQVCLREDSKLYQLPEDTLLSKVIENHLEDIASVSQGTNGDYLKRVARANHLSVTDISDYEEFLKRISGDEARLVPVVLLLTGYSVLGNIARMARIDAVLLSALNDALDQRILSMMAALNISELAHREVSKPIPGMTLTNFLQQCHVGARSTKSCTAIFGSHFPNAVLRTAEMIEQCDVSMSPSINSQRLKEILKDRQLIVPTVKICVSNNPYNESSLKKSVSNGDRLVVELIKNLHFFLPKTDDRAAWDRVSSVLYSFYSKALLLSQRLDRMTGDSQTESLSVLLHHFDCNAMSLYGNNYRLYFLVAATQTLRIIQQQNFLLKNAADIEKSLVWRSKKYIRSLRREIDQLRHQINVQETSLYKNHRDQPLPSLLNYRRSDSKLDLLDIIENLESQKQRLELRLKGLQDFGANLEARPRL